MKAIKDRSHWSVSKKSLYDEDRDYFPRLGEEITCEEYWELCKGVFELKSGEKIPDKMDKSVVVKRGLYDE